MSKKKTEPHPADIHAGEQLRIRRKVRKLSQETLAEAVGITYQQIQKYETGFNRMSVSRLTQFCNILHVAPAYFFSPSPYSNPHAPNNIHRKLLETVLELTEDQVKKLLPVVEEIASRG